ncbi:hypothetical protein V5799_033296 [Amblyomma americanum]|uniref:Uncharacterized protein n=1 Tax=Amblyomma americanum TaxID=6943 RepID=A0AAQ4DNQ4_AMBAM
MAVLFSALGSCCVDAYLVYVATRFVSSGGASTIFVITSILIYEVTPFMYQASYIVLMNIPFVCTNMFIFVMVRLDLPWFWLQTVVLSLTLLLLSAFGVISESPLWLITMSRFREAEEVVKRAAKVNGVKLEAAQQSVRRLRSQLKGREGSHTAVSTAVVVSAGQLRERAAIVFFLNFVVMLAFYRMVGAMLEHQDSEMVMVTDLKQILLFMLPLLGGLRSMCSAAVYVRPWYFPYVLMSIAKQCSILTMIAHLVFTAELFPTTARCAVMSAAYACGRVVGIVASSLRLLKAYRREDVGIAIVGSAVFVCLVFILRPPETSFRRKEHPNIEQRKDPIFLIQESLKPMPRASGHRSPRAARSTRR